MLKIQKQFEREILVEGTPVRVRLARLTVGERQEVLNWTRQIGLQILRTARQRDKAADDLNAIEAVFATEDTNEQEAVAGLADLVTRFISFAPDQVLDADDQPVVAGADIMRVFGGDPVAMQAIFGALTQANNLTPIEKKVSTSPAGSASGSAAVPPKTPPGDAPAETAAPV